MLVFVFKLMGLSYHYNLRKNDEIYFVFQNDVHWEGDATWETATN